MNHPLISVEMSSPYLDLCKAATPAALIDTSYFLYWHSGAKLRPWVGRCGGLHFPFYHRPGALERQPTADLISDPISLISL